MRQQSTMSKINALVRTDGIFRFMLHPSAPSYALFFLARTA